MKTIQEYLSGAHDDELRVLVAETFDNQNYAGKNPKLFLPFETSRDACEELLADLTEEEGDKLLVVLDQLLNNYTADLTMTRFVDRWDISPIDLWKLFRATPRQICIAYLIVKGVLK